MTGLSARELGEVDAGKDTGMTMLSRQMHSLWLYWLY
jgi:hypothetical protein